MIIVKYTGTIRELRLGVYSDPYLIKSSLGDTGTCTGVYEKKGPKTKHQILGPAENQDPKKVPPDVVKPPKYPQISPNPKPYLRKP